MYYSYDKLYCICFGKASGVEFVAFAELIGFAESFELAGLVGLLRVRRLGVVGGGWENPRKTGKASFPEGLIGVICANLCFVLLSINLSPTN
jgi:hypothetical protein